MSARDNHQELDQISSSHRSAGYGQDLRLPAWHVRYATSHWTGCPALAKTNAQTASANRWLTCQRQNADNHPPHRSVEPLHAKGNGADGEYGKVIAIWRHHH
jgi:hypothetical protein